MLKGKLTHVYTAGVIDGEGCIGIYKHKNKSKRGYSYDLIVSVWSTELWLSQWLRMHYGGSKVESNWEENHPTWKQQWKWAIYQKQAADFLKLILPYLQIKRPQAELAIAFQTKKRDYLKTEAQLAILEAERLLISKMNKRGK